MNFLDAMTKAQAFFDLFKRARSEDAGEKSGKARRIVLIVSLVITGILIIVAVALIVRKLKQRRLEKEAKEALDEYYSTEFDADEYAEDTDEEE